MRKQVLMFLLATGASVGGIFTVQPAVADCVVSAGTTCDATSSCTVNTGDCTNGGTCTVNTGNCDGGSCTINTGRCVAAACTINTGDCSNGDEATICHNTVCNNPPPGADKSYAGFGCAFSGGNEASGVLFNDPHKEFGEVDAGPWVVFYDPTTNSVDSVTITCTMQSVPDYGNGGVSRNSTTAGNVGVLLDTISFSRVPNMPSYLCTTVSWVSLTKGTTTTVIDDADNNSSNGYQCQEITYTN